MSVFVLAQIVIRDREEYTRYQQHTRGLIASFNGEVLVADEAPRILEGQWPFTRTLLVRFVDEQDALRWYQSDAYQAGVQYRYRAAEKSNLVLLRGLHQSLTTESAQSG